MEKVHFKEYNIYIYINNDKNNYNCGFTKFPKCLRNVMRKITRNKVLAFLFVLITRAIYRFHNNLY